METRRVVKIGRLKEKREERIQERVKEITKSPLSSPKSGPDEQLYKSKTMRDGFKRNFSFLQKQPTVSPLKSSSTVASSLFSKPSPSGQPANQPRPQIASTRSSISEIKPHGRGSMFQPRKSKWDWNRSQAKVQTLSGLQREFPKLQSMLGAAPLRVAAQKRKTETPGAAATQRGSTVSISAMPRVDNVTAAELQLCLQDVDAESAGKDTLHLEYLTAILEEAQLKVRVEGFLGELGSEDCFKSRILELANRTLPGGYDAAEELSAVLGSSPDGQFRQISRLLKHWGGISRQEWDWIRELFDFDQDGLVGSKDIHKVWSVLTGN